MAGILAIAGPVMGIGGSLFNMFSGKNQAQNVKLPQMWQAPQMTETANNVLGAIPGQAQYNTYAPNIPQAGQITQGLVNNPYAQGMLGGSVDAGNMAMAGAGSSWANAQSLYPYAQSVMQTGFDPQNALYDRTQHQLQEQTRAGQAARGISMSPYGAGLENKAMSDFNIDWQNQQLQRQIQGINAGAGAINTGSQVAGQAPGQYLQGATYPYAAFNTIGQGQMGALNQYGAFGQSASGLPQQAIQNYLQYLGIGNQANSTANQTAQTGLNQSNLAFNQGQTMGNQLGQSIFGLQQAFNKYPGSMGMSPYGGGGFGDQGPTLAMLGK